MNAIDMTPFIAAKSDQLNADDLIGGPRTITITRVTASPEGSEQPVSVFYEGDDGKPFRPCKTIRRVMVAVWGADASQYVGRSMTLYRDPEVLFGGLKVGGIRISHMSHIEREAMVVVMKSKGKKAPMKIAPLKIESAAPAKSKGSPEAWAAEHIGAVNVAATLDSLDAVIAAGAKAVAKLAGAHPDLHQRVTDAYNIRRAELTPDEQPGDQFDGAEWAE